MRELEASIMPYIKDKVPSPRVIQQTYQDILLQEKTQNGIQASDVLYQRLLELSAGRRVPVVVYNCIDFQWQPNENSYPQCIAVEEDENFITDYWRSNLMQCTEILSSIGTPELDIIVPDSELLDSRPFAFAQSAQERIKTLNHLREKLTFTFEGEDTNILFWSEYCEKNILRTPFEYTTKNREKILNDNRFMKKVKSQIKSSRDFFKKNGLTDTTVSTVSNDEMFERISWYCAMYAGEGQALRDSNAIVLNLEDWRVPMWFQVGADGKLPIITPVEVNQFYRDRRAKKVNQALLPQENILYVAKKGEN